MNEASDCKMWNKKLLRTKRTPSSASGSGNASLSKGTVAAVIIAFVIMRVGAEALYNDDASNVENNELESATAMIEFRNMLQQIVQSPRDSSLTLLQVNNKNQHAAEIAHQVRGLRFHAVQHPLLCDEDLSSSLNVQIVSSDSSPTQALEKVTKNLCAVWPVVREEEQETSASQLEWLSANGIERRSATWSSAAATVGDKDEARITLLVMHLGGGSDLR